MKTDIDGQESTPRSIRDVGIDRSLRLLVLAPHPDDFDAIGVTLRFLSGNGNPLQVVVACTSSGVPDSHGSGLTRAAMTRLREREQRDSARFFGLPEGNLTFLHLINGHDDQPVDAAENRDTLAGIVQQHAPDIVFMPHGNDTNSAHRAMHAMVTAVAQRVGRPRTLLLNRDPKTIAMRTDLYLPFGADEAAWKAELLRFHNSQQQRNLMTRGHGFDERILALNRQNAAALGLDAPYAETFETRQLAKPSEGEDRLW